MKIYMVGINHNDPLCRERLCTYLDSVAIQEPSLPAFIGVEWSEPIHGKIVAQREFFKNLIEQQWPTMEAETRNIIAESLGYEGDSHNSFFPTVPTLWLESGRENEISDEIINNYSSQRLKIYRGYVKSIEDPTKILSTISKKAWEVTDSDDSQRDKKWLKLIQEKQNEGSWAIVITGAHHCSSNENTLNQLLSANNFIVDTAILN